jgi:hypothetical protein
MRGGEYARIGEAEEMAPQAVGEGDASPLRVDQLAHGPQLRDREVPQYAVPLPSVLLALPKLGTM